MHCQLVCLKPAEISLLNSLDKENPTIGFKVDCLYFKQILLQLSTSSNNFKVSLSLIPISGPQAKHFLCWFGCPESIPKRFHESRKYKSIIVLKIHFHGSDEFQQSKMGKNTVTLPNGIIEITQI